MKIFTGKVIGAPSDTTVKIAVERIVTHPIYMKKLKRVKNYQVHDEIGVKVGDTVKFMATRPKSKLKKWKTIEVVGNKVRRNKK